MTEPILAKRKEQKSTKLYPELEAVPGMRVKLIPVSQSLIRDVLSKIDEPEVPNWHNPDTGNDEPNPADPAYRKALEKAAVQRQEMITNIWLEFGIELLDKIDVEQFTKKLKNMERRGVINLSEYDLNDSIDIEYLYKKYVIGTERVLSLLVHESNKVYTSAEKAEGVFQRSEE